MLYKNSALEHRMAEKMFNIVCNYLSIPTYCFSSLSSHGIILYYKIDIIEIIVFLFQNHKTCLHINNKL